MRFWCFWFLKTKALERCFPNVEKYCINFFIPCSLVNYKVTNEAVKIWCELARNDWWQLIKALRWMLLLLNLILNPGIGKQNPEFFFSSLRIAYAGNYTFSHPQTHHFLSRESSLASEENSAHERDVRIGELQSSMWWAMKNRRSWWPLESEIASFSSLSPIPSMMTMPPPSLRPPPRLPIIRAERFALPIMLPSVLRSI